MPPRPEDPALSRASPASRSRASFSLWRSSSTRHGPRGSWSTTLRTAGRWDVNALNLKGISKSVAAFLGCNLEQLSPDVPSALKVLSCCGSHVDVAVLEAVKNNDGGSGTALLPGLATAGR